MHDTIPILLTALFALLGLWHFYMALLPAGASPGAVPSSDGKPLFAPSRAATIMVGIVLFLFAMLVAATGGLLPLGIPNRVLRFLSVGLALGLFARAIGDFRYVGFLKRYRQSRFAMMDTFVYSPLCLLLSAGVATVAAQNGN